MKKADVLQLAIVLIGIVFGFMAIQYFLSSLYGVFAWIFAGGFGIEGYYPSGISVVAMVGLEILVCWLLITRSDKLAAFFYRKSELGTGFKIVSSPADLLHILLICIGIYLLLSNLTPVLTSIFESFIERSPRGVQGLFEDEKPVPWMKFLISLLLPSILLMFAKPIADYFAKNIKEEPINIEESIEGMGLQEPKSEN